MTPYLHTSARRRPGRTLWLMFGAVVALMALMVFPGCVYLAVETARAVDRKMDPPQKPLAGAAEFFGNDVAAMARLIPLSEHRRELFSKKGERDAEIAAMDWEDAPLKAVDKNMPPVRKVVLVSLLNRGTKDARITVDAVETSLGALAPVPLLVLLAPGQRAMIATIRSPSEPKIDALDVTVRLRAGELAEVRILTLQER